MRPFTLIEVGTFRSFSFQVDKMDFPAKLLGNGAANGQGNGRLANAAGTEQRYEPLFSQLVADLADDHFAPNHHDRSQGKPALLPEPGVPAFRVTSAGAASSSNCRPHPGTHAGTDLSL
jgi:hypothetical protein